MKVRELIAALSKLDPELAVVMWQQDEPPGDYEVNRVDTKQMKPDGSLGPTWSVWHDAYLDGDEVAYLYPDRRLATIDGEILGDQRELT
jgi:hypothetical protein